MSSHRRLKRPLSVPQPQTLHTTTVCAMVTGISYNRRLCHRRRRFIRPLAVPEVVTGASSPPARHLLDGDEVELCHEGGGVVVDGARGVAGVDEARDRVPREERRPRRPLRLRARVGREEREEEEKERARHEVR